MATLPIIREVASAMMHLKSGGVRCKVWNGKSDLCMLSSSHEHGVSGVFQFKRRHSYVIFDDGGKEWQVQSMWQIKKP